MSNSSSELSENSFIVSGQLVPSSDLNNTATPYAQDKCVHQLFEEQVDKTPNAIAIVFEDEQLTYLELNQRANQLAHYLQELGVGPEVLVGLYVERSLEMIVGILGNSQSRGGICTYRPNLSPRASCLHVGRLRGEGIAHPGETGIKPIRKQKLF